MSRRHKHILHSTIATIAAIASRADGAAQAGDQSGAVLGLCRLSLLVRFFIRVSLADPAASSRAGPLRCHVGP